MNRIKGYPKTHNRSIYFCLSFKSVLLGNSTSCYFITENVSSVEFLRNDLFYMRIESILLHTFFSPHPLHC